MTAFIPSKYNSILLKIYDLSILKKEKVTFAKLTEFFEKKDVCKALEYLCCKNVIEGVWDKSSGQWVRTFEIVRQYMQFVEALNNDVKELPA